MVLLSNSREKHWDWNTC